MVLKKKITIAVFALAAIATSSTVIAISISFSMPMGPTGIGPQSAAVPVPDVFSLSPLVAVVAWASLGTLLVWKGAVKSVWKKHGYEYDTFKLVAKMRGSPTRVQILKLLDLPKNKLQLANEMSVDWRTIDNHIAVLMKSSLVDEMAQVGTSRYYIISENGKKVLDLLNAGRGS